MKELVMEVIPSRSFNMTFIIMDIVFLLLLLGILIYTKRYMAILFGVFGIILYVLVDYGVFYAALGTREVIGGSTFWVLLWMSTSYGFTNFAWICLWFDRDKKTLEWSLLIVMGWLAVAMLSQAFGGPPTITTIRGTHSYHGIMAVLLLFQYSLIIIPNLIRKEKPFKDLPWILAIGLLVQFAWEAVLLISGVRFQGGAEGVNLLPLIVNSLIETNMGVPVLYLMHRAATKRWREDLTPTPLYEEKRKKAAQMA